MILLTWATLHASLRVGLPVSVSGISLLTPWGAVHMVPEFLPKTRLIVRYELKSPYPLCALPEIEMRHQKARGSAVYRLQRAALVAGRDHRFAFDQVFDRNIGTVVTVT